MPYAATDFRFPLWLTAFFLFISAGHNSWAGESGQAFEELNKLPVMPLVEVEASRITPTTGVTIIDKELLDSLPSGNGSINEIIGIVPGVQYAEEVRDSFTAGEITPPGVSISGSRIYENNYTIDGLSNNNPVDPANDDISDATKLPSHPQSQFLAPELLDQLIVYNSNIPAEFGGFTGGQIDATTIRPDTDFWGQINYRTTSDNWTKFYLDTDNKDKFYNSSSSDYQPQFKKHDAGLTLNIPLTERTGLLTSYQQLYSKIPLHHFTKTSTQTRRQENFFLKLGHEFSASNRVAVTASYSPTQREYFLSNVKDSHYRIDSGGYSLAINTESEFSSGLLETVFGYNGQSSKRDGDMQRFRWNTAGAAIDWDGGFSGSHGPLETGHDEVSAKASFELNDLHLASTAHQIKVGAEVNYSNQYYNRPETNYYYYYVGNLVGPTVCVVGDPACIPNDQYLNRRTKYFEGQSRSELFDIAAFAQDSIAWKRLEIFPGVRISHNDVIHDLNIAPRFSASLDLFGNRNSILFFGKNRYYSGTLHTFTLYKAIYSENELRATQNDPWVGSDNYTRRESDIKTPYTDETTVGLIQRLLGGELKIQYIQKTGKDELTRSKDKTLKEYTLNNNGRSEHDSYLVSWQRYWKNHFLEINSTWQKTTSNHTDYESTVNDSDLIKTRWIDGKEVYEHEKPRTDYNRPVVANLIYSGKLPYGFTFTNVAKFRGPYTTLKYAGKKKASVLEPSQPSDPLMYETVREDSSLIFDWKVSWSAAALFNQDLTLTLDIYNVFNRKAAYKNFNPERYELGRQYWAGLTYRF